MPAHGWRHGCDVLVAVHASGGRLTCSWTSGMGGRFVAAPRFQAGSVPDGCPSVCPGGWPAPRRGVCPGCLFGTLHQWGGKTTPDVVSVWRSVLSTTVCTSPGITCGSHGYLPTQQIEEGGIRWPALEIQVQRLVESLPVPAGKSLQISGAAAAAQDPQYCHQQQEPLRIAHPAAVTTIGDGLKEADQVISSGLIDCRRKGFGHWQGEIPLTKPNADSTALICRAPHRFPLGEGLDALPLSQLTSHWGIG